MVTTQRPRVLFFGAGGGDARLLLVDSGTTDGGAAFIFLARSNPIAPAQPSQEIAVFATYLVVTAMDTDTALQLKVRLYVNQDGALERTITIPATVGERRYQFEVSWHESVSSGGAERTTLSARGSEMILELESSGTIPAGRIVIDGVESEVEVLGETLVSTAS